MAPRKASQAPSTPPNTPVRTRAQVRASTAEHSPARALRNAQRKTVKRAIQKSVEPDTSDDEFSTDAQGSSNNARLDTLVDGHVREEEEQERLIQLVRDQLANTAANGVFGEDLCPSISRFYDNTEELDLDDPTLYSGILPRYTIPSYVSTLDSSSREYGIETYEATPDDDGPSEMDLEAPQRHIEPWDVTAQLNQIHRIEDDIERLYREAGVQWVRP